MVSQLDLLLRYISLRTFDTNTTVILKCLEVLHAVFANLADDGYHLLEFEVSLVQNSCFANLHIATIFASV